MARQGRGPATSILEWVAAAVGLVVALGMLGVIAWDSYTGRNDPVPILSAEVVRVVPTAAGHVVEVRVRNHSDQTAAAVQLQAELTAGTQAVSSAASVDYVPGQSQATAGFVFAADPRRGTLAVRVTGYEVP